MANLIVPPVGFDVEIISGPDKGRKGTVVNPEYTFHTVEYWDDVSVLEPGVYKRYAGAIVELEEGVSKYFDHESFQTVNEILLRIMLKEKNLDRYSRGLIPHLPITRRKLFKGDIIQDKESEKMLTVDKINYDVMILGTTLKDKPIVTAIETSTEKEYGFKHLSEFRLISNGDMAKAIATDSIRANLDQVRLCIKAGVFPAVRKEGSASIYHTAKEIEQARLTDTQFVYPYDKDSVRYVIMDTAERKINPDIVTWLRKYKETA